MNQMDHILHNFAHFVEFSKVFTIQQRLHNFTHFAQECMFCKMLYFLH